MKLTITADDYTAAACIDKGIEEALTKGCINCVSAMVNNQNSLEKINSLHSRFPDASIGLHLTLTSGRPISAPESVSTLLKKDDSGEFMAIEDYDYYRVDLFELVKELEAQINAFHSAGVPLDHLSCHHGVLNLFEDFFKLFMSLAIKNNTPIRNPILISRQRIKGFKWSYMKREGLSKAFKLADDVGILRLIRTSMETKPKTLAKRMIHFKDGAVRCPDFFIDTYYGNATKSRLKKILNKITKGAISELVVHLSDGSDCDTLPNGINEKYLRNRKRELKNLLRVNTKKYINEHSYLNWGSYSESKMVKNNPFFQY